MDYTSKNTEFRSSANAIMAKCEEAINNEQLISEITGYFIKWYTTGQKEEIIYENEYIDKLGAKYREHICHTIDSLVLWCEMYFDSLYVMKIIQKYDLPEEELDQKNSLFLNKPTVCTAIKSQKDCEELFVVAMFNLMKSYMYNGIIPEHILKSYRFCKLGYHYAKIVTGSKLDKIKKLNKRFADSAASFYGIIMAQGYSVVTRTNGFFGRAFSMGKQTVRYNIANVASNLALGAHAALSECKILYPFYPEHVSIFEQFINPYFELDKIFSKTDNFVNYDMEVDDSLQKLLNFSWFDSGMLGVRENMNYHKESQINNINVYDMNTLSAFVHGALLQANSWGVDGGPKAVVRNTMRQILKQTFPK